MRFPTIAMNTADAAVSDAVAVEEATSAIAQETEIEASEPEAVAETPGPPKETKKPWFLDRIAQESAKAREASERAEAAERRAKEFEALAERLRAGKDIPAPYVPQTSDGRSYSQAEIRVEAEKLRFHEDTVEVRNAGLAKFGASFTEALTVLNAVGATSDDFIQDVLAVSKPEAHLLLDRIAKDPEKAVALASMTSRQRIAELARMTVAKAETPVPVVAPPAHKTVSKAPPPAPKIEPSASKAVDGYSDDATDEQFTAQFMSKMKERSAIGRR